MPLKELNPQQKKAVSHKDGPLLIVAGAGTGKTTVITERVAWLIEQGLAEADEILALTFTDKAATEMEERVDKLLPYGYVDLWIMTFHSFGERILKNHALDIGIPNDFKLLNQTQQWMLVRENLDKFNLDYYRPLGNPTKFIHALVKHFSRCKDEIVAPEDYIEYAQGLKIDLDNMESTGGKGKKSDAVDESEIKRLEEVANAYHIYQQLLLDNQALDFGDLINYTLKLFKTRSNILKFYQNKFKYILVDEFQDTNYAQYELVKLLAGDKMNLTVVGDADQSVFKFRGASISNILQFKDDYPKSADIYLNQNYRSSQNILDMAYNFIQLNNPERLGVKLGNKELSKKLEAATKDKGKIEHLHLADENQEVETVVNKIIELKNDDQQASWNDFAILIRANNQAEAFLNGLSYAGVPFNFVASKGLYSKPIVRDILAYLKLLDDYHESMALWRILNLEVIKMDIEDLMELTKFARRKAYSLYETISQAGNLRNISGQTKKQLEDIIKKIKEHTQLAKGKSIKQVIYQFLKDFKYYDYLIKQQDDRSTMYVNSLLRKVDEFEKSVDDKSLNSFMQLVALELESGEQGDLPKEAEEGPEAVRVMTIHSAKGLEFKYVWLVNLVDKRFPSIERREAIELPDELVKEIVPKGDIHLQEERRLFYVALTRAKREIYFSSAENYGGKTKKKLSRFLYETGMEKKSEAKKAGSQKIEPQRASLAKDKKIKYELPASFSYSQLKAFENCPYQYYLNFILKLPVMGKASFSYGKTMHSTLQKFMALIKQTGSTAQGDLFAGAKTKDKKLPTLNELLGIYRQVWIDDWFESKQQKEDYKKLGEKSLKEFYAQLDKKIPNILELEKGFNFKVGEYTIRGAMDRVDEMADGKVEIIDYKTGSAKTEKSIEKDQLLMYQIASQEVFNWQVDKLTFYYLDNNKPVSFLGSQKDLDKIKDKILGLIEGILKYDWQALPSQYKCRYCDFKDVCQFRQL